MRRDRQRLLRTFLALFCSISKLRLLLRPSSSRATAFHPGRPRPPDTLHRGTHIAEAACPQRGEDLRGEQRSNATPPSQRHSVLRKLSRRPGAPVDRHRGV